MRGLEKLRKKPKAELIKMAKRSGVRFSENWNRTRLATKILEKQKLDELKDEPVQAEPETEDSRRKPDFEALVTEGPEIAPDSPQVDKEGPGGVRPGAGRPPGMSDEKARVQRLLKNTVPEPVIKFAFECLFESWETAVKVEGLALSDDEINAIAVPTTNLKEYYLPNLNLSPVLEMWIGLAVGVKAVVQSRIVLIREARKAESVTEPTEKEDDSK